MLVIRSVDSDFLSILRIKGSNKYFVAGEQYSMYNSYEAI